MKDTVTLSDPRSLRALAHPTRLRLVGLLRREGPMTATEAGKRIGDSAASCSFHFRQLAKHGLVAEAPGGKGRERPWRATSRFTSWKITRTDLAGPSAVLSEMVVERQFAKIIQSVQRLPGETRRWQRAHLLGDVDLLVTPEELARLGKEIWKLLLRYQAPGPESAGAEPSTPGVPRTPRRTERGDSRRSPQPERSRRRVGFFMAGLPIAEDA